MHEHAVGVAKPESIGGEAIGRLRHEPAVLRRAASHAVEIVRAKREVVQPLAGGPADQHDRVAS